ncbi:rhodanese-like domain-containing protein [Streptomyces sp. GC420]|uniref:rhodanese-like domain-containing protein n=1 Tax=Streptomyces sp. GC420 TaxID=2697568 RepID=UPI001414CE14|nr:rhodanese-like domain-containing protein [Streptomyces sp. GC420]NBM17282.1 rhodanese-like domain-containing protein [Streptomyces sp. GC420]
MWAAGDAVRCDPGAPEEAPQAHRRGAGGAVLLDVRERVEWTAGRAPGAAHASLSGLGAGGALPAAAQGRPLVVVCRSGHRSRQAAKILAEWGCETADLKGGVTAWLAAGLPVVGGHRR